MIFFIIAMTLTVIILYLTMLAMIDIGSDMIVLGIVALVLIWGPWPMLQEYEVSMEPVVISNLHWDTDYVSFMVNDYVIVKRESKFVNREFTLYRRTYENWYGIDGYELIYKFGLDIHAR